MGWDDMWGIMACSGTSQATKYDSSYGISTNSSVRPLMPWKVGQDPRSQGTRLSSILHIFSIWSANECIIGVCSREKHKRSILFRARKESHPCKTFCRRHEYVWIRTWLRNIIPTRALSLGCNWWRNYRWCGRIARNPCHSHCRKIPIPSLYRAGPPGSCGRWSVQDSFRSQISCHIRSTWFLHHATRGSERGRCLPFLPDLP